jgi:hypothetical protein
MGQAIEVRLFRVLKSQDETQNSSIHSLSQQLPWWSTLQIQLPAQCKLKNRRRRKKSVSHSKTKQHSQHITASLMPQNRTSHSTLLLRTKHRMSHSASRHHSSHSTGRVTAHHSSGHSTGPGHSTSELRTEHTAPVLAR